MTQKLSRVTTCASGVLTWSKALFSASITKVHALKLPSFETEVFLLDFYDFCVKEVGGTTGVVMQELLEFEADRRAIIRANNNALTSSGGKMDKVTETLMT